jgi:methionyl-tRNA formyltransferase
VKIVFMGTPDFSVLVLDALVTAGHDVARVYTQPPRSAGRGHKERRTPVHMAAERHGLEVATPTSFRGDDQIDELRALKCEAAVVVAYGLILPQRALEAPQHGCFNLHASLLPRWRGAAPIQRAIMAGDTESGVCVMRMTAGLDAGPVCLSQAVAVNDETTAGELHDALAQVGATLMVTAIGKLADGKLDCTPQPETGVTYARKIDKAEAQIDFDHPARGVLRHIHGLSPFPGAWLMMRSVSQQAMRIKILRCELVDGKGAPGTVLDERMTIACANGAIRPVDVQREGKAPMKPDDFLRGFQVMPGSAITRV